MLRLLAVLALLFAVFALPNAAKANAAEKSILAVSETAHSICCDEAEAVSEKPSACKPDCKALYAALPPASPEAPPYHIPPYLTAAALFKAPVDLRPPIS